MNVWLLSGQHEKHCVGALAADGGPIGTCTRGVRLPRREITCRRLHFSIEDGAGARNRYNSILASFTCRT